MEVICIHCDNIDIDTNEICPAPVVGEICFVLHSYEDEDGKWYELLEYPKYDYEQQHFIPILSSKTTVKLENHLNKDN